MTNYYSPQENASTAEKISPSSQEEVNLRGRSTDGQFRTCNMGRCFPGQGL